MDLKKEIKLSDLFRRRSKPAAEDAWQPPAEEEAKREKKTGLKREINLSFSRRNRSDGDEERKATAEPKSGLKREVNLSFLRRKRAEGEAEPKAKREKQPRRGRAKGERAPKVKGPKRSKGVAPTPQIPLMRAFNLLPKDDGRQVAERRGPSAPQLGIAVAGLVLVAALGSLFLISNAQVADKKAERAELVDQLAAREVPVEEPKPEGSGDATLIQERDARTGALGSALGNRVAWDRILRELSLVLPEDVWLSSLTGTTAPPVDAAQPADPNAVAATPSGFEITGYARQQSDLAQLLSRLTVLPEVETASLRSATATEVGGENVIEFAIGATVKPRAPGGGS
jgi:Tfp pilus assembly protein PilN